MKKVTRKELAWLAVILIVFSIWVVPRILFPTGGQTEERRGATQNSKKTGKLYFCPMHPTYISDRAGDCPICFMKLVPKPEAPAKRERKILYYRHPMGQPDTSPVPKKDEMGMDYIPVYEEEVSGTVASEVPTHAAIHVSLEKQQLMGVKLGKVERRKLVKGLSTSGRIAYDPELYAAQQEFISAVRSAGKAVTGPYHEPLERTKALVASTRTRLRLLGMSEEEMKELEESERQDRGLILPSDVGTRLQSIPPFVWVYAAIYEYEIPFVQVGTPVRVRVPTFPNVEWTGEVRALRPVLDSMTRSFQVRARVQDPSGLLLPEMYVDISIEADLGEKTSVPEEAVMFTGEHTLVFVSRGEGHFEPRAVTLGTKADGWYEVKSGLKEGEPIAVSGNFLIDSESRLQAALQGMTGAMTEGGHEGHAHGN